MIDLTNKTIEEVNALIQKYADVLQLIRQRNEIPYLAVVIEEGIKHVKEKHADLKFNWKAWSILYLKHWYLMKKIKKIEDIPATIDYFIKHYKDNYQEYIDSIGISATEFDRDHGFVCKYLNKKG